MPRFTKLLKNKNFVLYSIGQAFSQFGDRLVQIVLIGFVYKRWPGSTFQLAKLFFFTILPSFLISPIAGVYIDRWNKKYVMIASDVFRAIAILFIPIFFIYRDSIIPIYAVIFFIFLSACFFLPARLSVIPSLVPREDLLLANSASTITWVISGIAGFSFGGFLAEWIGIRNSLYINSCVYFLSATSFLFLVYSMRKKVSLPAKSFIHDLIAGLKTFFFNKKIRFVACTFFIFSSIVGACYVVLVVFIQETLHTMTRDVGLFGMWIFAGVLAGSYTYGKIGQGFSKTKTVFISIILVGAAVDAFAIALKGFGSFLFGSVFAFLIGFFISPTYVTANTIIHETIEENLRGRIFSSLGILMNAGFISFMFLSSLLAERVDRFWILIACGSGFGFLGIVGLIGIAAGLLKKPTFSS